MRISLPCQGAHSPHQIAERLDFGLLVHADDDVELVLNRRDEIHHCEAVELEISCKSGGFCNLDALLVERFDQRANAAFDFGAVHPRLPSAGLEKVSRQVSRKAGEPLAVKVWSGLPGALVGCWGALRRGDGSRPLSTTSATLRIERNGRVGIAPRLMDRQNIPQQAIATSEDAAALALRALEWVLSDQHRAQRFLDLTGLTPEALRRSLAEQETLAAVFDFLAAHEPDLTAAAAALNIDPSEIPAARARLEP